MTSFCYCQNYHLLKAFSVIQMWWEHKSKDGVSHSLSPGAQQPCGRLQRAKWHFRTIYTVLFLKDYINQTDLSLAFLNARFGLNEQKQIFVMIYEL